VKDLIIRIYNNNNNNNNQCTSIPIVCRPGISYDGIHYGQRIFFHEYYDYYLPYLRTHTLSPSHTQTSQKPQNNNNNNLSKALLNKQIYEVQHSQNGITGLLLKIVCYNNYGDLYYLGLDHILLYDEHMEAIDLLNLSPSTNKQQCYNNHVPVHITALPYGLSALLPPTNNNNNNHTNKQEEDARIPSALFHSSNSNNSNNNNKGHSHCWLAPLARSMSPQERLYQVFSTTTTTSTTHSANNSTNNSNSMSAVSSPILNTQYNLLYLNFHYPVKVAGIRSVSSML
jgi:hypothetical protein